MVHTLGAVKPEENSILNSQAAAIMQNAEELFKEKVNAAVRASSRAANILSHVRGALHTKVKAATEEILQMQRNEINVLEIQYWEKLHKQVLTHLVQRLELAFDIAGGSKITTEKELLAFTDGAFHLFGEINVRNILAQKMPDDLLVRNVLGEVKKDALWVAEILKKNALSATEIPLEAWEMMQSAMLEVFSGKIPEDQVNEHPSIIYMGMLDPALRLELLSRVMDKGAPNVDQYLPILVGLKILTFSQAEVLLAKYPDYPNLAETVAKMSTPAFAAQIAAVQKEMETRGEHYRRSGFATIPAKDLLTFRGLATTFARVTFGTGLFINVVAELVNLNPGGILTNGGVLLNMAGLVAASELAPESLGKKPHQYLAGLTEDKETKIKETDAARARGMAGEIGHYPEMAKWYVENVKEICDLRIAKTKQGKLHEGFAVEDFGLKYADLPQSLRERFSDKEEFEVALSDWIVQIGSIGALAYQGPKAQVAFIDRVRKEQGLPPFVANTTA